MTTSDPPTNSLAPGEKGKTARLGAVLGAFTDWLAVILIALGVHAGTLPVEPWAYIAVGIASPSALAGAYKRLTGKGTGGGSASAIVFALAGKLGLGGVLKAGGLSLIVLLVGCATMAPLAKSALQTIAPIAAELLRQEAERRDVDLDESEAICVPLPDEYQPEGQLVVVCAAPEADE